MCSSRFASGCGSDSGTSGIDVVATNSIAADIARNVAGPDADVDSLLPETASPHDYALSAKDRAELEEADVVVAWGAGLEAGFQLSDDAVELAGDRDDPHIWMDPTLVAAALPGLATALGDADPDHAGAYRRRAAAYGRELERLDTDLKRTYSAIPPARRKLVSSHDSIGYLVRRYGFEFVGAPFGVTPGHRAERGDGVLADRARRAGARARRVRRGHGRPEAHGPDRRAKRASRWWTTC